MKEQTHRWWLSKTNTDYNMMVRLEESDENGYGVCITCGVKIHYKQAHAGHFLHGLDFTRDNQHFQCAQCNNTYSGRLDKYTLYMLDHYGRKRVDELYRLNNQAHKYSIPDLMEMRATYKAKIKELQRRPGNAEYKPGF